MEGDNSHVYTVDEALTAVGFGKFQYYILAYAGLGWISEAMEVMILSFVGPAVKLKWGLSSSEESLITTVVFAGMLVGAYSWGLISDNYGRRRGLLSVAIVSTGAGFLSSFSPNYISLIILRCLVGIGLGGGPVYSSWFLEFVPTPNRGTWMVVFSAFWSFGTVLEASLAWIILPRLGWRWLLALSSLPSFMALIFYICTPESPRYLCMRGEISDASKILEKIANTNKRSLPFGKLTSTEDDTHSLCLVQNKPVVSKAGLLSIINLLSSNLVRITLPLWLVFFGNAFSYYGIILLTSNLSTGQISCLNSMGESNLYKDVFFTSLAEFPGLVLAAILVDRIGRKLTMVLLFITACCFLLPLVIHERQLVTTSLLFVARMCTASAITVANIYAPEIYPTSIRSTGFGVASAVGRIGGMVCPLVAVELVSNCHQTAAIFLFEAVMVVSIVGMVLLPHDTSGRALTDD
ncbi:organic cation/carnitine transporter 7-like [Impatiens glandulifera]|uniref:organic cation/carnitine transporter 7-like n=1 Tax=Impatiens glandulifera TaxID=253017 RepID=UPI001FB0D2E9|nr:organic cation/carnitine transporter 7-like [Impatiens glandulifera]XP_047325340.1 organic cation/carnitine transporter 7-like [Impatiens glandulifera]